MYRGTPVLNEASWQLELEDIFANIVQVNSAPESVPVVGYGRFPAKAFWYPVYFHLADAVFTAGTIFNLSQVKRVKLSSVHPLPLGSQIYLDSFEAGRTSEVTSVAKGIVEAFNEISPNASYTRPWPVAPAVNYLNAQTFRLNVGGGNFQELDPTLPVYDVNGFSGYIDWNRNSKLMGSWQTIVKSPITLALRWKLVTMPTFADSLTYAKKHIFEGISVMWRNIV
jgi:hypothetical protein